MSRNSLRMLCPHCGATGEHQVIETEPSNYYRVEEEVKSLFKRLVGRDLLYRKRLKKCTNCGLGFCSVEMPEVYLNALISGVKGLTKESSQLRPALNDSVEECRHLRSALADKTKEAESLQKAVDDAAAALSEMARPVAEIQSVAFTQISSDDLPTELGDTADDAPATLIYQPKPLGPRYEWMTDEEFADAERTRASLIEDGLPTDSLELALVFLHEVPRLKEELERDEREAIERDRERQAERESRA